MYEKHNKITAAAIALAKSISLPSTRGSVFAWNDIDGERIVVAADHKWIMAHRSIPSTFRGFPVSLQEQFSLFANKKN